MLKYVWRSYEMFGLAWLVGWLQVIRNLVSNALKFTPKGGTVTIFGCSARVFRMKHSLSTNQNVSKYESDIYKHIADDFFRLEVTDTGAGISKVCESL